jgi:hypothetical protein
MALKDITITGSIGSYPTLSYGQKTYISSTDEQSFPIEQFTGSSGGATPNFNGQYSTTDLFVNITQSWNGSIDTQVGIVDFTHNTQEEFINGEYSGSGIEVTHQRLIDEDCIQLLNVSTIPTNYKPFFYVAINSTPFDPPDPDYVTVIDNFLNINTSPNPGETYILSTSYKIQTSGGGGISTIRKVTHIKVNKLDDSGNDNTLSLQELTSLRILFSDLGVINFPILSITEYPTYYLYSTDETLPSGLLNSADNNVLNYYFSASSLSSPYTFPVNGYVNYFFSSYNVSSPSTINSFNSSTGIYLANNSNNIPITLTASFTVDNSLGVNPIYISFVIASYPPPISTIFPTSFQFITVPANTIQVCEYTSSQVYLQENTEYTPAIILDSNSNTSPVKIYDLQWMFTQSVNPNASSNITILNPYLTKNFEYSDCNVLINNATNLEYDPNFYKVNYDTGLLVPSNQQQILDGTAEFAPVKPYNYSLNAQVLPRYNGVRVIQQNENVWTDGDIAPSKTPSVRTPTTYFAYFTSMQSTSPMLKDKTSIEIKYLLDEFGNIYDSSTDQTAYNNLVLSFERSKKAYASLLSNVATIYSSPQPIRLSGFSYTPILYSFSSSYLGSASYSPQINFQNPQGSSVENAPNYGTNLISLGLFGFSYLTLNFGNNGSYLINSELNPFCYNTSSGGFDSASGYVPTPSSPSLVLNEPYYRFNGLPASKVNIKFSVYTNIQNNTINTQPSVVRLKINRRTAPVGVIASQDFFIPSYYDYNPTKVITLNNYLPSPNEEIYFTIERISGPITSIIQILSFPGNTYQRSIISITSQAIVPPNTGRPFWLTGSSNSTTITSSGQLGQAIYGGFFQQDISNSGMPLIENPSQILIGDEIRFEYDESNTFRVIDVEPGSDPITLSPIQYVTVDSPIPTSPSIDINNFVVRRLQKDTINAVTLDTKLISSIPITNGFLFPEYPSDQILSNLSFIINKLTERNII